jgi:hypothetical protein
MHLLHLDQSYTPSVEPHDDHHGENPLSLHSPDREFYQLRLLGHVYNDVGAAYRSEYYLALWSLEHSDH